MKYSTDIQRTAILNKATNPNFSDVEQYNAMKKLFEVPYAGRQDDVDVSTEDKIRVAYKRFEGTDKTIKDITNDDRQREYQRSRAAKVYFDYDRTYDRSTHRHRFSHHDQHGHTNNYNNSSTRLSHKLRSPTDKQIWQSQAFNTGEAALLLSSLQQQQQSQEEQYENEYSTTQLFPPDSPSTTTLLSPSPSSRQMVETGRSPSLSRDITQTGTYSSYPTFNPNDYSINSGDIDSNSSDINNETARARAWQRHRALLHSADLTVGNLRDPESILRKVTKKLSTRLKTIHMTNKYGKDAQCLPPLSSAAGNVSHAHHLLSPTYHHVRQTALKDVRKMRYGSSSSDFLPPPRSSPMKLSPIRTPK